MLNAIAEVEGFGDAFERIMPGHRSFLRINYYPHRQAAHAFGSDETPLNCVEHFDSGLITLLFQDDVGGLEVQRYSTLYRSQSRFKLLNFKVVKPPQFVVLVGTKGLI